MENVQSFWHLVAHLHLGILNVPLLGKQIFYAVLYRFCPIVILILNIFLIRYNNSHFNAKPGPGPIKKISRLNFRYDGLESSYWLFESSKCSDQSECLKTTIAEIMIQFHFYIGTTPGGTGFKTTALKQSRDRLLGLWLNRRFRVGK